METIDKFPKDFIGRAGDEFVEIGSLFKEESLYKFFNESSLIAFPYLYRRFGRPTFQYDDYKELGSYLLTTENRNIHLWIRIDGSDFLHSCGYFISKDLHQKMVLEANEKYGGINREPLNLKDTENKTRILVNEVLKNALLELQKVVYIRDLPININGPVSDSFANDLGSVEYYG